MDIFRVHNAIIDDYRSYVDSFLTINDSRIRDFVHEQLIERRRLWPDALLQLNPAYEKTKTVAQLVSEGVLHPGCADIFVDDSPARSSFHLYRHQTEAIARARNSQSFIVTSGTGSGKTMSYLIPIFDAVLRSQKKGVHAIIVYPMNALVNSQEEALDELAQRYQQHFGREMPVRYGAYTGQTDEAKRLAWRADPPHIILTNYVMLELMLIRGSDHRMINPANPLTFLVLDELHTYRGRQGADVALLVRRLKERTDKLNLLTVGTSATMATGDDAPLRRRVVADFASKLLGNDIHPQNVIEEKLRQVIPARGSFSAEALRAALDKLPSGTPPTWDEFAAHPLSTWIENTFGLRGPEDDLRRVTPISIEDGAKRLAAATGRPEDEGWIAHCREQLQTMLLMGTQVRTPDGDAAFAFKLHQFISQGGSLYATLEEPDKRHLTLNGGYYAPGEDKRLLFPIIFCRHCGQEYYTIRRDKESPTRVVPEPANFRASMDDEVADLQSGYLVLDPDSRFDVGLLPDDWFSNGKLKKTYQPHEPKLFYAHADGRLSAQRETGAVRVWFQPTKLRLCLSCGESYDGHTSEGAKLTRLSSAARSTATSLLGLSTVSAMRQTDLPVEAQKLLSFTDNRQDASLQAGHFNDFIQAIQIRGALQTVVSQQGELAYESVGRSVFAGMGLELSEYAGQQELDPASPQARKAQEVLVDVITYRLIDDFRRRGFLIQPNLEESGLLRVGYHGLEELAARSDKWVTVPYMRDLSPDKRTFVLTTILDEMRRRLAIDAPLIRTKGDRDDLKQRAELYLAKSWKFAAEENPRYPSLLVRPDVPVAGGGNLSFSRRSNLGRWLREWPEIDAAHRPTEDAADEVADAIIDNLLSYGILVTARSEDNKVDGVRISPSALRWQPGDGTVPRSPLSRRRVTGGHYQEIVPQPNAFYLNLYSRDGRFLQHMNGAEHTAQIRSEDRREREDNFRAGKLAVMFCSPTMELGVDIRDLNAVHLRNIPPTPANYAQRSGRAGRAGQPALVIASCAVGNNHDQYYFNRRDKMVAGVVAPPRIELSNPDLLRAHIHAIWLAHTGLDLGHSIPANLIDTDQEDVLPLKPEVVSQLALTAAMLDNCRKAVERVLAACRLDPADADWLTASWIDELLADAPRAFDQAFDRWRELYRQATKQLDQAQLLIRQATRKSGQESKEARRDGERLEREALRQIDLLKSDTRRPDESDFYPYRYLASEGFLPGYNFPALPVRAYVGRSGDDGEYIARPRALAVTEFGPHNIIYHDGAQYRVQQVMLPLDQPEKRFARVKLCGVCGCFHDGEKVNNDLCDNCGSPLNQSTSVRYYESLLEMPMINTRHARRITAEEEERTRRGYRTETVFRFADMDGQPRRRSATTHATNGHELLRLMYAPTARLWTINHGLRRQQDDTGFRLDMRTGRWLGQEEKGDIPSEAIRNNVRLFVRNTANILLVYAPGTRLKPEALPTLQYALARGIQNVFQVEGNELHSELIGSDNYRGILLSEATEGGLGVLRPLVEEPAALAEVARQALEILHFDAEGNDQRPPTDEDEGCARACYDCLLSYYNQSEHERLDRHLVRDFLLALTTGVTAAGAAERDYGKQYAYLVNLTDPESDLERIFLDYLYGKGHRLPDAAQKVLDDAYAKPDFFYEPNICVFVDGSHHDEPQRRVLDDQQRRGLKDLGYRVVVYHYLDDPAVVVARYPEVFGGGR